MCAVFTNYRETRINDFHLVNHKNNSLEGKNVLSCPVSGITDNFLLEYFFSRYYLHLFL